MTEGEQAGVAQAASTMDWSRSPLGTRETWPSLLAHTFDLILDSPIQIVCFWGPEYCAIYNDAYAPTIGSKHPQALGRPASENWSELWDDLKPLLDQVRLEGRPVYMRDRPFQIERHGYMETVTFDIAYSPVRGRSGAIAGVICIVNETTERIEAERKLRENEARLQFLDDLNTEMMVDTDADATMSTATRMLGEHLGVSICAYADMEADEDGFTIRGDWAAEGSRSIVGRYKLADFGRLAVDRLGQGAPLVVSDNRKELAPEEAETFQAIGISATICMPLVKNGKLTALMAVHDRAPRAWTAHDITLLAEVTERCWVHIERVRDEENARDFAQRAQLATAAAAIGTWDYDPVNDVLQWDQRCKELFGVPPEMEVTYKDSFLAGLHDEDRADADAAVQKALSAGANYDIEFRTVGLTDGRLRWIAATGHALMVDGSATRFLGTVMDITERKRTQAELQSLNATLEQRVVEEVSERLKAEERLRQSLKMEAVGQLTGGIAHDFNNMLAVVIGGLNLLQRRLAKGDTDVGRFVEGALEGAHRAASLTQRLLAFSRQQPLSPEAVDANRLVLGMSELLSRTLGEQIRVETVLAAGLWRSKVDTTQLENALLNLSVNARDAMPEGGKLTIETSNAYVDERYARESSLPTGQYVLIAVSDSGVGMDDETAAKAFDPFFTTKAVGKGTGLGLSQVYGFVRQSGGNVKIYSEPGVGTTVKIYLPRFIGESPVAIESGVPSPSSGGGSGEVIMVVEDYDRVRSLSVEILRELGYDVIEASGPLQAIALIEGGAAISLLFTDVVMPDMSGRQLVDKLREKTPELKVLYTTGYTRNAIVHNGVLDSGTNLLTKPYNVEDLASKVRQLLDE